MLGNHTRLSKRERRELVERLLTSDPTHPKIIADELDLPYSAVASTLREMANDGAAERTWPKKSRGPCANRAPLYSRKASA